MITLHNLYPKNHSKKVHAMNYNFDEIIDRSNTACVKYDLRDLIFGRSDVVPLWVADMDFRTPNFIIDALKKRLEHEILGYSIRTESYYNAFAGWLKRRHNWEIKQDWVAFSPGIVPALNMAVLAFTQPGDRIIVQPPVYFPFFDAVSRHGRNLVYNELILENGRYHMDYNDLEKSCIEGATMLILSNPHNPGGNAWSEDELRRMAEICLKYNVLVVSDEIHCDLVNKGYKHTVLASLSPEIADFTLTMMAPSKTFNLAGLATASVIISNPGLMRKYTEVLDALHIGSGNIFGNAASEAAYLHGDEWLGQLLEYIQGNIGYLEEFIELNLPVLRMIKPEATYMVWLDFSLAGMNDEELKKFLIEKAGLGLNEGTMFGPGGSGFMRMNLACPRKTLGHALDRLKSAFSEQNQ